MKWPLLISLVWCGCATTKVDQKPQRFLFPSEVVKKLEASPIAFTIASLDSAEGISRGRLADEAWPRRVTPIEPPMVTREGVKQWPQLDPSLAPKLAEAEAAFRKDDWQGAAAGYRVVLEEAPDAFMIWAYLGDALLWAKDDAGALGAYNKAIALNPYEHHLYYFRASVWRHRQGWDQMFADLQKALALSPQYETLRQVAEQSHGFVRIAPERIVPARWCDKTMLAFTSSSTSRDPEWLAWANCKALWLTDAEHRTALTGNAEHVWSNIEERECLANLVAVYVDRREKQDGPTDERLDDLIRIVDDQMLDELIFFELGSRVDPQIMLRIDAGKRARVEAFVKKHVLPVNRAPLGGE